MGAWNTRRWHGRGRKPTVHKKKRRVLDLLEGENTHKIALDVGRFDSYCMERMRPDFLGEEEEVSIALGEEKGTEILKAWS